MESNVDISPQTNLNEKIDINNDNLTTSNENFNKPQVSENINLKEVKNEEISNDFLEEEEQEGINIIYKDSEHKQIKLLSLNLLLKKIVIENFIEDNPLIIYYFCQQCFCFIDKQILFLKIISCYNYYHNKGIEFNQLSSIVNFFNILVIEMLDYYNESKEDDPILTTINNFYENIKSDLNEKKNINKENSKNDENNLNINDVNNEKSSLCSNNNGNNNNNDYYGNKDNQKFININDYNENNNLNFNGSNKENDKDNELNNDNNGKNNTKAMKNDLILNENIETYCSNDILYNKKEILDNNNISNKSIDNINIILDNIDDDIQNINNSINENNVIQLETEKKVNGIEMNESEISKTGRNLIINNLINEINDNDKELNIHKIEDKKNEITNNYLKYENETNNNPKFDNILNDNNKLAKKKLSNTIRLSNIDNSTHENVEKSDTITRLNRFSLFFSFRKNTPNKETRKSNLEKQIKKNKSFIDLKRSKKFDMKIKVKKVIPSENEILFYISIIRTLFTLDKTNLQSVIKSSKEQFEFYKEVNIKLSEIINHPIKTHSKKLNKSLTENNITKRKKKNTENIGYFNVLDFNEKEICETLMKISIGLLNKIERKELYKAIFLKKDKLISSPNVMKNIEQFNKLTFFIIQDIISYYSFKERAKILEKWAKIGDYCRIKKDYNDLIAINSALNNYIITNLKTTFKELKSKTKSLIKEINSFCNCLGNYQNIRDDMKNLGSNEYYIPYLGILLRDFAYFEENFKYMNGKMINLEKLEKIQIVMEEFFRFKNLRDKVNYTLCKKLNFFEKLENIKENEIEKLASKIEKVEQNHIHKYKIKKLTVIDKKYFSKSSKTTLSKSFDIDSRIRKSIIK